MKTFTDAQVLDLLRKRQGDRTQKELAAEIGISDAYISDIFQGKRSVTDKILTTLGLERAIVSTGKASK